MAQAVGRLGNWLTKSLNCAPTTLPWGLKLNMEGSAIGHSEQCYDGATCPTGTLFHPTFLYEMIWNHRRRAHRFLWFQRMMKVEGRSPCSPYTSCGTRRDALEFEALRFDFAHEFLGVRINVWVSMARFLLAWRLHLSSVYNGSFTELLAEKLRTVTEIELSLVEDGE